MKKQVYFAPTTKMVDMEPTDLIAQSPAPDPRGGVNVNMTLTTGRAGVRARSISSMFDDDTDE